MPPAVNVNKCVRVCAFEPIKFRMFFAENCTKNNSNVYSILSDRKMYSTFDIKCTKSIPFDSKSIFHAEQRVSRFFFFLRFVLFSFFATRELSNVFVYVDVE